MATLPDSFDLGQRPILRAPKKIVSDQSGQIRGEALAGFGDTVTNIASRQIDIQQAQQRKEAAIQDKLNYAKARAAYQTADIQARQTVEQTNDWQTGLKNYSDTMTKAKENALGMISDQNDKALFEQDLNVDRAQGDAAVGQITNRLRVSSENADLDGLVKQMRNEALTADDQTAMQRLTTANMAIDGAVQKGNLGPDGARKGAEIKRNLVQDYATSKVGMQPLQQQVNILRWGTPFHATDGKTSNAFEAAVSTESGGQQFDSIGAPLMSDAGAIGISQLLPSTAPEAAQLAGVPYDENKLKTDKEYNRTLGSAYFQKQMSDFGDDPQKAWAAYNAGPGATRNAIEKYGNDWLSHMPQETQDYVARNSSKYDPNAPEAGAGVSDKMQPSYADFIDPDTRHTMLLRAEEQLNSLNRSSLAELRNGMNQRLSDLKTTALLGNPIQQGELIDKSTLMGSFGNLEGARKWNEQSLAFQASKDIPALHAQSNEQIVQAAQSYRPTDVHDAYKADYYAFMSRAAQGILQQRAEDPAGYLVTNAPASQQAWQKFQSADLTDATATKAAQDSYFNAVKADAQTRGMRSDNILPENYAKSISQDISSAKTANELATRMDTEAAKWGDHWSDVFPQIAKDLPDFAAMAGSGLARNTVVAMARTAGLKTTELEAMLPPGNKWTDVKKDVASTFAPFFKSFPVEGGSNRTVNAIQDSAERLAVTYMHDFNESQSNAVKHAYKDLAGVQGALVDFRGATVRVSPDAQLSEDEARAGMQVAIQQMKVDSTDVFIPQTARMNPQSYVDDANAFIRSKGYFMASGDGKGVTLYVNGNPWPGKKSQFTWEQLKSLSETTNRSADMPSPRQVLGR